MKKIVRKIGYKDLCEGKSLIGFTLDLNLDVDDDRVVNIPEKVKILAREVYKVPNYIEELSVKGLIKEDNTILIGSEIYYQTDDIGENIQIGTVSENEKEFIINWIKNNMDKIDRATVLDTLSYEDFIKEYTIN